MNLFCLLTGHDWENHVIIDHKPTNSLNVNGTTYTGNGLINFTIKRKRTCKKCGCKQFFSDKGWEKEPLTKKELRDEKIKKILKK